MTTNVPCKECILLAVCVVKKWRTVVMRAEKCSILSEYIYRANTVDQFRKRILRARRLFKLKVLTSRMISSEAWENYQEQNKRRI